MSTQKEAEPPKPQADRRSFIDKLALPFAYLTLAALSSAISQATLAPVFGALPSAVNHKEAVLATSILAFLLRFLYKGFPRGSVAQWTAIWAFWVPLVQMYLFNFSERLGPMAGPGVIGFLSCHTILIPSTYAAAEALEALAFRARFGPYLGALIPAAFGVYHLVTFEGTFQTGLPQLTLVSSAFNPVQLQLILASIFLFLAPSKYVLVALPAFAHTLLVNPHIDSILAPNAINMLNNTLHTHNWSLVDRRWSITGYISVLDNLNEGYRAMRCDHSLLGGEWLLTEERREKEGLTVNEPIYAVFEMLEAVRLLELNPTIPDAEAHALVVGLGTGTCSKAFLAHGISTTIVEVDPVVHEYATKYFGLPEDHIAVLEDAVEWVNSTAANRTTKYDYIIHDVFTGGAEPLWLFTEEFLNDLRSLLKPNGVIALNYAGDVNTPLTSKILNTIRVAFKGQCKIYRDTPPDAEITGEKGSVNENFANLVTFCRNSPGKITFRKPTSADFLGSKSREYYLLPDPKLEIQFPLENSDVQSGESQTQVLRQVEVPNWSRQQAESAVKHWHVMRKVVQDAIWELW